MPFAEAVYKTRRIVLVRIKRARIGSPRYDYPDVDDRGWLHDPAGTGGETPAEVHGPVVGMQQDKEIELECERLRLEPVASGGPELYLKSHDTGVVSVTVPAAGAALAANGRFKLKGATGSWREKFTRVTVHVGSDSGPLIAEFGVRVFRRRTLLVQPWLLTIQGRTAPGSAIVPGPPATSAVQVTSLCNIAKRIWRQCGIHLSVRPALPATVTLTISGQITENTDSAAAHAAPDGTMVAAGTDDSQQVHQANRTAGRCNVWWVQRIVDVDPAAAGSITNAWALDNTADSAGNLWSGVVMTDGADGNDLAHELGHYLSLDHSDEPAASTAGRDLEDVQVLRHLMFRFNPHGASPPAYRSNVGYGAGLRGALLTMRDKPKYRRDDEWFETRRHLRRGPY